MKKIVFGALLSFAIFSGCSKDNSTIAYTPTCDGAVKSYSSDVAPLVRSSCVGCHQNLSTYSQVIANKSSVRNMIVSGQMPKGGSLSDAQKNTIVCWIDNGAVNN